MALIVKMAVKLTMKRCDVHDFETAAFMRLDGLLFNYISLIRTIITLFAKLISLLIFLGKLPITHCNQVSITGQVPQIR